MSSRAVAAPPVTEAAVLVAPRRTEARETPLALLEAHQILIAVEGSGVCASSMPVWEGRDWFQYPLGPGAPGHEGWGRVVEAGSGSPAVGSRVAFLTDKAFARHVVVGSDVVVPIPASLDDQPVPAEALACAMNIFRRSDIRRGQTVAIIGIGFLGALLCRLAANAGARVIAISRRSSSLELARSFGAGDVVPMIDHWEILRQVRSLVGEGGCDRVIEAVGLQWPLDLAGELVREGGRLVIAGYHQDGTRQVNVQQWNWKGIDVINAHERDSSVVVEGMRLAIDAIVDGSIDPAPLYSHQVPLERLDEAYELMHERPDGLVKVLMVTG